MTCLRIFVSKSLPSVWRRSLNVGPYLTSIEVCKHDFDEYWKICGPLKSVFHDRWQNDFTVNGRWVMGSPKQEDMRSNFITRRRWTYQFILKRQEKTDERGCGEDSQILFLWFFLHSSILVTSVFFFIFLIHLIHISVEICKRSKSPPSLAACPRLHSLLRVLCPIHMCYVTWVTQLFHSDHCSFICPSRTLWQDISPNDNSDVFQYWILSDFFLSEFLSGTSISVRPICTTFSLDKASADRTFIICLWTVWIMVRLRVSDSIVADTCHFSDSTLIDPSTSHVRSVPS